jgi:two-component system NtrC family sensor kinase
MTHPIILIVYPDSQTGQYLQQDVLNPAGYQAVLPAAVVVEMNWDTTRGILLGHPADMVIIGDLPGEMDGIELAMSMIAIKPLLPVLLVTTHYTEERAIQAFRSGVADYIAWPGNDADLLTAVQRLTQRRQQLEDWIQAENSQQYARISVERNQLGAILTKVEEGVVVVDLDERVILINPKACRAFGIEDRDWANRPVQDIIQHLDLLDLLTGESPKSPTRLEITLDDGRILNAQVTPIPEVGLVVTMQDITYLKEIDRVKSEFVSTVSHDLRSPLTAILGYVELLDRVGPVNSQQSDFIRRIRMSVNNITALINDLLDLGRIEAGFDVRNEVTYFNAIIGYAIEGMRSQINEKNQVLIVDVSDDLPPVLGNPIRLRQMVNNLLGNAVKYTPAGGEIRLNALAEGDQIIFRVADNGPGIPAMDQPYIFDKFYRASNIQGDIPGTGLGLAIVKSIVENHRGRIWIESAAGQGAAFTVVLPRVSLDY